MIPYKPGDLVRAGDMDGDTQLTVWSGDLSHSVDFLELSECAVVLDTVMDAVSSRRESYWVQVVTPRGKVGVVHETYLASFVK